MFSTKPPGWFYLVATLGLFWNLLGAVAFAAQMMITPEMLAALPEAERALYEGQPRWVLVAFAVAMPVAASWIGAAFGLSGDLLRVGVLESAMPPMITAGAVAAAAKLEPELAAALVGFGIVLSFVSMPLLLGWL